MLTDCFLDTNVLVYAATGRVDEPEKFSIADELLSKRRFGISAQVLAEFVVNYTRKPKILPSATDVDRWLDALTKFPVVAVDEVLVRTAIVIARRFQIHYYDAAILYTEDLNHGQRYGAVLVQNPFHDL